MVKVRYAVVAITSLFVGMTSANADEGGPWGALAAGITSTRVGVGSAIRFQTKESTERAALNQCGKQVDTCRVVYTFSNGCGYITTGVNNSTRVLAWGSGASAAEAVAQCKSKGVYCKPPIGTCTN